MNPEDMNDMFRMMKAAKEMTEDIANIFKAMISTHLMVSGLITKPADILIAGAPEAMDTDESGLMLTVEFEFVSQPNTLDKMKAEREHKHFNGFVCFVVNEIPCPDKAAKEN